MHSHPINRIVERLRHLSQAEDDVALTDAQLLECFIGRHEEAAFEAIVRRHGSMVLGVCRRLLRHTHDADDAFQATFLILARKAASIRSRALLANWLYGVAYQTALKARVTARKRQTRERPMTETPEPEAPPQERADDWQPVLDRELNSLPEKYRIPILLCDLGDKTRRDAARELGVPEGTLNSRLARRRMLLAKRLARHGVALSGGAIATVLSQHAASACVPVPLLGSTVKAAIAIAAGKTTATVVSAQVAALMEGVMKSMFLARLRTMIAVLCAVALVGSLFTTTLASGLRGQADKSGLPLVELPERDAVPDLTGTWKGVDWGTVVLKRAKDGSFAGIYSDTFGKDVGRIAVRWVASSKRYEGTWSEGTFRFGRIALEGAKGGAAITGAYTTDPKCEHQPGVPSLASLRWTRAQPDSRPATEKTTPKKEAFTAWGKVVSGLQGGIGYRPGQKRSYSPGTTVPLVVRVRNVGKETVTIRYYPKFFIDTPPAVTDAAGKPVALTRRKASDADGPVEVALAPGKEAELYELKIDARAGAQSVNDREWTLLGTGKYQVQYERMMYSSGKWAIAPILSELGTGKLDLDIQFPTPVAGDEDPRVNDLGKSDLPPAAGKDTPPKKEGDEAGVKRIKIRVYIEKVNLDTSTITASCMLIGEVDGVTRPVRMENLRVADKATITDRGKKLTLNDVKLLPRDTHFYLSMRAYEEEFGFEVVGIETIRK